MEIASSWKLHSVTNEKINISKFTPNTCLFSPDGKTFCKCASSSITFISNEKAQSIAPPTKLPEEIRCITTVFTSPWILSIGTSSGRVLFYDISNKQYLAIQPDNDPVQFIKMCSFTESYYTKPYPVLFIQYPKGICATIDLDQLASHIKDNNPEGIIPNKWQLSNDKNIRDSIVINSNIPFPFLSNAFQFPIVYSIGKPFISVSSISCPKVTTGDLLKKGIKQAKKYLKWMFLSENNEEESLPISRASDEWDLDDDKREGVSMSADPTGRWIAIGDNMHRVIIFDSIVGHITKVLKGYRDAQFAWFSPSRSNKNMPEESAFLVIYVPTREIIVVCSIPDGITVAAVKVVRDGKLFQTIDENSQYGVTFIYPTGDVAILNISLTTKSDNGSNKTSVNEIFDSTHFNFPSIVTVEKNSLIQELQKLLLQKKWEYEEVKKLASEVSDKIVGGYFIKLILNSVVSQPSSEDEKLNDNDFLLDVIDTISSKLKIDSLDPLDSNFFENCNNSNMINGVDDLAIYKVLSTKWSEYSKFESLTLSEDQYPQTSLTEKYKGQVSNIIDAIYSDTASEVPFEAVRRPNLRSFLISPLQSPLFFFSFMRSSDIKVDSIYESFRVSKTDKNNFISQFMVWVLTSKPTQILLTQESIVDFFSGKTVKNIASKFYKKLDVNSNPFNSAALSEFLFS